MKLHTAASHGQLEVLRELVAQGAELEQQASGLTPLACAVAWGQDEAVAELLGAGADPNTPSLGGLTPLHLALVYRRPLALVLLLKAGADPQAKLDSGAGLDELQRVAVAIDVVGREPQARMQALKGLAAAGGN